MVGGREALVDPVDLRYTAVMPFALLLVRSPDYRDASQGMTASAYHTTFCH